MIHSPQRTLFQTLTIPPPEAWLPLQDSILWVYNCEASTKRWDGKGVRLGTEFQ